ncbi:sensor histidine kinase [Halalkalibacter urbisdiaboli]|uniref:sensor histidine kinase n=1 Tax=Halalkalibacter urbisdiaboli TaxID=1960589 RepID=UPI0013FDB540|nr:sensor histidine kinase [Halalkalibacter urbisdiaboli]
MGAFWVWLFLLFMSWLLAVSQFSTPYLEMPFRIFGSAGLFALFFLAPLLRSHKRLLMLHLSMTAIIAIVVLWPEGNESPNIYTFVVFSIIAGKAVYRLSILQAIPVGVILVGGVLISWFHSEAAYPFPAILLYVVVLSVAFYLYKMTQVRNDDLSARYEALLSEYRKMKRRIASDEKQARAEERTEIARQIHDSVGHKLTALLMQLEVFRMKVKGEEAQVQRLKLLAKESLEETRIAVKALKQDEAGGLTAIISLIRKLEAESFIRIQFSIKHGALTAPLTNEQTIAVYRAVQEALTNMMRHSGTREVEIVFEAPAGSVFRFEVANPILGEKQFREGFGLSSMRERVARVGGNLDILQYAGRFIVRGTIPLQEIGRLND